MSVSIALTIAIASVSSVSFELYDNRIYMPVLVNGHGPYKFALDTGASGEGRADARLVATEKLPAAGYVQNSDGVTAISNETVQVASLKLGPLEKRAVELPARDYNKRPKPGVSPMMGIIGRDFFAGQTLIIDYPQGAIRISTERLPVEGSDIIAFDEGLIVPICFGTVCVKGKIDTGSNRGLVLPASLVARLQASDSRLLGEVARTNGSAQLREIRLAYPITIGGISVSGATYSAAPAPDYVNIGGEFLKNYVVTIDMQSQRLRLTTRS